jgi:hypothetical protein
MEASGLDGEGVEYVLEAMADEMEHLRDLYRTMVLMAIKAQLPSRPGDRAKGVPLNSTAPAVITSNPRSRRPDAEEQARSTTQSRRRRLSSG